MCKLHMRAHGECKLSQKSAFLSLGVVDVRAGWLLRNFTVCKPHMRAYDECKNFSKVRTIVTWCTELGGELTFEKFHRVQAAHACPWRMRVHVRVATRGSTLCVRHAGSWVVSVLVPVCLIEVCHLWITSLYGHWGVSFVDWGVSFVDWGVSFEVCHLWMGYGVAFVSRIDKIIGLFCKRDL